MHQIDDEEYFKISHLGLQVQISAMAVATSFILILVPNVETISITAFLIGFLFPLKFAIITVLTMVFTWEILASMIFAFSGITFPFKILAWLFISGIGYLARKMKFKFFLEFAILGAISALIFDILVTIPLALFFYKEQGEFLSILIANLVIGIIFTASHFVSNTLLFAMIPFILKTVLPLLHHKYRELIQLPKNYFDYLESTNSIIIFDWRSQMISKRRLLGYSVTILLLFSLIITGLVMNQQNKPQIDTKDEINVLLNISYNNILANESFTLFVTTNETILQILEKVAVVNVTLQFSGEPFVEAVNNVWQNRNITGYYWIFYINLDPSQRGAGSTYLSNGDEILWSYEK